MVLVQILKQEWPTGWPTFIPEIVASSKTNLSLCENNMIILKLLSEEIFDFSAETMTSAKQKELKNQMCAEFSEVFQLCHEILDKAGKPTLVKATLETLLRFLSWVPLGYIFETNVIEIMTTRVCIVLSPKSFPHLASSNGILSRANQFLPEAAFRNVTLQCLTEIGSLKGEMPEYHATFVTLFTNVINHIRTTIPLSTDFVKGYEDGSDEEQNFIQNLGNFLVGFLGQRLTAVLEQFPESKELILSAHHYLLRVSLVKDREVFKTALEYWNKFVCPFLFFVSRISCQTTFVCLFV